MALGFLVSPEVAFQNLVSYLIQLFITQVKGRDERGLPLFAFSSSLVSLAMTACVWEFIRQKTERIQAVSGGFSFAVLLFKSFVFNHSKEGLLLQIMSSTL